MTRTDVALSGSGIPAAFDEARAKLAALNWKIVAANVNLDSGYFRLVLHRAGDRPNEVLRVTLMRSGWDSRTVTSRDVAFVREGWVKKWLDVAGGFFMGMTRHDSLRHALRFVGNYVADNAGAPRIAGRNAMRPLVDVVVREEAAA